MADGALGSPGGGSHESGEQSPRSNVREQDRYLPIANISRIMKKALPANGKVAKDAKETVQECVSEFISFVTSEASDKCQREKRKTINGDDLLWAMATLGFEDYIDPLKKYLTRYREMEGDTKGSGKGGEGSGRKDGVHPGPNAQLAYQGSFSQGINYGNSQADLQQRPHFWGNDSKMSPYLMVGKKQKEKDEKGNKSQAQHMMVHMQGTE
ncbi:nuclear transcription factor Y subunit B-1-like isoform X1 [Camellia sinensis]|uniref:nuclear transcription factor Y subunit B-1-like isoform X1 n=1 Tax=Camellia sinensis TaxID=4442 RepID=UPI001035696B|nr:nuclear transcription factor Y subunit B-1-like isoform X1 [Camellia sinensis]